LGEPPERVGVKSVGRSAAGERKVRGKERAAVRRDVVVAMRLVEPAEDELGRT